MKQNKSILGMCIALIMGIGVHAQSANTTTGGNALGSGGSAGYTVGQVVYQTHAGTNGSVAEGVQQPYEISVITGIEEAKGINLTVYVYPNPTAGFLELIVESEKLKDLSYQLFDMNGKLLQNKKITGNQTSIVVGNLMPATYFVKIIQGNREVKTFKIIKD